MQQQSAQLGMSTVVIVFLLMMMSVALFGVVKKMLVVQDMLIDVKRMFTYQESLNALALASVSICKKLVTKYSLIVEHSYEGVCAEWPYENIVGHAYITLKCASQDLFLVTVCLRLPEVLKLGDSAIEYELVFDQGACRIQNWTLKQTNSG